MHFVLESIGFILKSNTSVFDNEHFSAPGYCNV